MSTGTVSPQFDQFSESSTVVGVDKTREEYSKLFSRATYSPLFDRPYSSPISGSYDAINTSTRLVLLNYRFKNSHLREQVVPEELTNASQRDFEYEINVIPHTCPLILIDILKGQNKYWHNRRCTTSCLAENLVDTLQPEPTGPTPSYTPQKNLRRSSSVNTHRSPSVLLKKDKYQDEPQSFSASVCQYYRDAVEKSDPTEFASPQDSIKEAANQREKSNGIPRKLPLTKGQQLYLTGKHHTYDIQDTKLRRTNSYAQTLSQRYKTDYHCKPQFRLNGADDYFKYSKFLQLSPSKSPEPRKPLITTDSHKSFTIPPSKSSPIPVRLRPELKPIPPIPMQTELKTFI